jgi:hypothetical protein
VEYTRPNALHCWILRTGLKSYQGICRVARRLLALTFAVCEVGVASPQLGDVIAASDEEWQSLAIVTGFHIVNGPKSNFQARILEANGQATVAINPIALFLVVTNDSSAGDLQQHIWRLPLTVAQVKSVAPTDSGVHIVARLDAVPDANVKARDVNVIVRYEVANGVLKNTITVQQEQPKPDNTRNKE